MENVTTDRLSKTDSISTGVLKIAMKAVATVKKQAYIKGLRACYSPREVKAMKTLEQAQTATTDAARIELALDSLDYSVGYSAPLHKRAAILAGQW